TSLSYVPTIQTATSASHLANTIDHHLFRFSKIKNLIPILSKPSWIIVTIIVPKSIPTESVGKVIHLPRTLGNQSPASRPLASRHSSRNITRSSHHKSF